MNTSQRGIDLIKQFEGFRANRYLDSVGVPTIGYGTTAAVIRPLPATTTQQQAEQWLRQGLARYYEPAIRAIGVPLNQNQFDALASFAYNLGPGALGSGSSIGRSLRARNYKQASRDFMLYVNAGGNRLQGLVNRRAAERRLFDTPAGPPPPPKPPPPPPAGRLSPILAGDGRIVVMSLRDNGVVMRKAQQAPAGAWAANWSSLGKT